MDLTKNFTAKEFYFSKTAKNLKIDNMFPPKYYDNVQKLANTLQIIRDVYNCPIIIKSGYRCPVLNKIVKGASNSDHLYAAAADIVGVPNMKSENKKLFDIIVDLADKGKISCRQIIDEYNYSWIHISVNNEYNKQKTNQILHLK